MARKAFKLPDIGEGVVEGEIVTWHVEVGSPVSEDDAIVDVMTDKSTVTIPSPYSGTIVALNGEVGDMVAVGAVLVEFESTWWGQSPSQRPLQNPWRQRRSKRPCLRRLNPRRKSRRSHLPSLPRLP